MKPWTTHNDEYVKWNEPPYKIGGMLFLVLDGEDPTRLNDQVLSKRRGEYMKLERRRIRASRHTPDQRSERR